MRQPNPLFELPQKRDPFLGFFMLERKEGVNLAWGLLEGVEIMSSMKHK